jgi:hypothetical protein
MLIVIIEYFYLYLADKNHMTLDPNQSFGTAQIGGDLHKWLLTELHG